MLQQSSITAKAITKELEIILQTPHFMVLVVEEF
jgi:hypothetical protein